MTRAAALLLLAALVASSACSSPPDPAPAPVMEAHYVQAAREQGAIGMTDEQLLVAGTFVCAEFGNMARPEVPYARRFEAYQALFDHELVPPGAAGNDTLAAILNATPFLCLRS